MRTAITQCSPVMRGSQVSVCSSAFDLNCGRRTAASSAEAFQSYCYRDLKTTYEYSSVSSQQYAAGGTYLDALTGERGNMMFFVYRMLATVILFYTAGYINCRRDDSAVCTCLWNVDHATGSLAGNHLDAAALVCTLSNEAGTTYCRLHTQKTETLHMLRGKSPSTCTTNHLRQPIGCHHHPTHREAAAPDVPGSGPTTQCPRASPQLQTEP